MALIVLAGCKVAPKPKRPTPPTPPLPSGAVKASKEMSVKRVTVLTPTATEPTYEPSDFALTSIRRQGPNVVMAWQNGVSPFQIQSKTNILGAWIDYGPSTSVRQIILPAPESAQAYFRVRSGNPPPDQVPPTVTMTAPANGSTVSNVVTLAANATDDVGVTLVEFYLDGSVRIGADAVAPYSFAFNTAPIPNGTHFLSARAYDASGKTSNSLFVIVTIGNSSPFTGTCIWSQRFGGTSGKAQIPRDIANPVRIASGMDNSVVVAGYYLGAVNLGGGTLTNAGASEISVAKYGPTGLHLWSKRFGGIVGDQAQSVAVDTNNGDVVVIGEFGSSVDFGGTVLTAVGASLDIFLLRMSSAGNVQWAKRFGNASGDAGRGVVVDGSGNAIITGYFEGTVDFGGGGLASDGLGDVFLAKYSTTGQHVWSKRFGSVAHETSVGIAVDGPGNPAITGTASGAVDFGGGVLTPGGGTDIFAAKYNAAGTHVWSRLYGGLNAQRPVSITMNSTGTVALAGNFLGTLAFGGSAMALTNSGEQDIFVARLGVTGLGVWARSFGFSDDVIPTFTASDVSFDAVGNVLFTGSNLTGPNSWEGFIRKLSVTGATLWDKPVSGIGNDGANAVTVDSAGNTLAVGFVFQSVNLGCGVLTATGFTDALVTKLSP